MIGQSKVEHDGVESPLKDSVARLARRMDGLGAEAGLLQAMRDELGEPLDILYDQNANFALRDRLSHQFRTIVRSV